MLRVPDDGDGRLLPLSAAAHAVVSHYLCAAGDVRRRLDAVGNLRRAPHSLIRRDRALGKDPALSGGADSAAQRSAEPLHGDDDVLHLRNLHGGLWTWAIYCTLRSS